MSRSGYSDDFEDNSAYLWYGAVKSAIRGKRGQAFLREMLEALDALPRKSLSANSFTKGGEICALGSVAVKRCIDVSALEQHEDEWGSEDEVDRNAAGQIFGIAPAMAAEIMYMNDEYGPSNETPEERWTRIRGWVMKKIRPAPDAGVGP